MARDAPEITATYAAQPSEREAALADTILRLFWQLHTWRATTGAQWEEIAELILPTARNTFFFNNFNWPGQKKTDRQIDATGMLALHRFAAICDSLITPRNSTWHGLEADDPYVMKDRATRLYFEDTTRRLFKYRYAPIGNFSAQNNNSFQQLGAFGNQAMFVDAPAPAQGVRGLRYKSIPMGEMFWFENHQGLIDGFIRWFRLTARQAKEMFKDKFPEVLKPALDSFSQWPYDFLHYVAPREDFEPGRLDHRGMPIQSIYVSVQGKCVLSEGGYRSFPAACSRYEQTPGEVFGRGPAGMVLPGLKTLNAEKRTFLKAGHRTADPILLSADDGLIGAFNMTPGAMNSGAINADGKLLVQPLPIGNIQISKEMMAEEKGLINDAFLVTLFQILTETPQMTATEVIERMNEKGILMAPTLGRQHSEYVGPLVTRELDLLSQQGLLAPMPPRLREAGGEYNVVYTNPLARAMRAQEAAGFMRAVETTLSIVNATQDPSLLDAYDFDRATRGLADIYAVPESWMASDSEKQQKQYNRAQTQQRQQQIQAAPAMAAMMKAKAAVMKAGPGGQQGGMGQGGGLGGQPQGQAAPPGSMGAQPVAPGGIGQ